MISIINAQSEPIQVEYDNNVIFINANDSFSIENSCNEIFITIMHTSSFANGELLIENMIGFIAKSTVLIVDSTFHIYDIVGNATIAVSNNVYEHDTKDFGYLYFEIKSNNCKTSLKQCNGINKKKVLHMQKIVRFSDCFDFPPFSIPSGISKYRTIKKMCDNESVLKILRTHSNDSSVLDESNN